MAEQAASLPTWTASDGYVGHYRRYLPTEPARAHVICLHGVQSHGGWYEYSSRRLCQAGFAVYYLDRRGSGANAVDRGDAPSFRRLVRDVADFVQEVVPNASPMPVILCACSWGGKLAAAVCRRHPNLIDGLALLCPGMFPRVGLPFRERLRILWARLVAPRRRFPIPLSDPTLFTATPHWREFIANDPLSLREASARLLVESVRLDLYLRGVPRHVTAPTLLMLAQHDEIIDNERTRRFVQSFAARDKEIIEFRGAHHTLEFEPEPDRFIDELIHWLRKRERLLVRKQREMPAEVATRRALNLGTC